MKEVTIFEANDGARFNDKDAALRYEVMLAQIAGALSYLPIPPQDDGCSFANGNGYLQHTQKALADFDAIFAGIIRRYAGDENGDRYAKMPTGMVWRIIDGGDPVSDKLCRIGTRRCSIDGELREWGQLYYAANENGREYKKLN